MTGAQSSLLFIEVAVTAVAAVILIWRSFENMKEEDHLILTEAEEHLAREQAGIRKRISMLTKYLHVVGVVWSILAAMLIGMLVVEGLALI